MDIAFAAGVGPIDDAAAADAVEERSSGHRVRTGAAQGSWGRTILRVPSAEGLHDAGEGGDTASAREWLNTHGS